MASFVAVGFNLQVHISILQARRAAGLGACKGAAQRQTQPACWRRAEQTCEPCKGPAAKGGRPQKKAPQKGTLN
ncbi:hypothetical protein SGRA_3972 [Saprospira grandis str. Lewin]|uniref:Uncharacterized protein n=1 Tax=Saprospira grandis (strain Lewin) TaxID=984262 RepID=H6L8G2_SAPGL|nr:hypothetical protein SGRA_3972 [Saprospira grandis str. Lewin]